MGAQLAAPLGVWRRELFVQGFVVVIGNRRSLRLNHSKYGSSPNVALSVYVCVEAAVEGSNTMRATTNEAKSCDIEDLIHDWNSDAEKEGDFLQGVALHDRTLQALATRPNVHSPSVSMRLTLMDKLVQMGVRSMELGDGQGPEELRIQKEVAVELSSWSQPFELRRRAEPVAEEFGRAMALSDSLGRPIQLDVVYRSKLRSEFIHALGAALKDGLSVGWVTPANTPAVFLREMLDLGARRIVLTDTVGEICTREFEHIVDLVGDYAGCDRSIQLDWDGRNDHGLGVAGALWAAELGVSGLFGTLLGIGDAPVALDQVALNLDLLGCSNLDLKDLVQLCEEVAHIGKWPIPLNYPLMGRDAFRTATGVHASAIAKALARDNRELADRVYSSVPASRLGRQQTIDLGPMSGMANVRFWLSHHGIPFEEGLGQTLLEAAKCSDRVLFDSEIIAIVNTQLGWTA